MGKGRVHLIPAVLAVLVLSGCGTFHNLDEGGGKIYGGVRTDLTLTGLCVLGAVQEDQGFWERAYALAVGASVLAVDVPLSLAADTLTLPLTSLVTLHRLTVVRDDSVTKPAGGERSACREVRSPAAEAGPPAQESPGTRPAEPERR